MGLKDFFLAKRAGPDRRGGERRDPQRRDAGSLAEQESRANGERRQVDRRGLRHGVILTTAGRVGRIEEWLDGNCQGRYSLEIEDMSADLDQKTLRIMFEKENDHAYFKRAFAKS